MLRQILVGVISLAIIVACYFVYAMLVAEPLARETATPAEPIPMPTPSASTKPAVDPTRVEDVVAGAEGEKSWFNRWDKDGRLVYQFRVDHWRSKGENEFALDKPELRVFLGDGQIVHISAPTGRIEARRVRSQSADLEPVRGALTGKVHVFIDRGTDPKRPEPELREKDIIHIWLERVEFDLEANWVRSDSAIKVDCYEAELSGKGLQIKWDQTTRELQQLTIREGEKLIYRTDSDTFQLELPGGKAPNPKRTPPKGILGSLTRATESAMPTGDQPPSPPQSPVATGATTTSVADTQPKKSRAFRLTFTSTVRVFEYDGPKLIGRLTCDRLYLLFDIPRGRERRQQAAQSPPDSPATPLRREGKRLEIFWKGPLEMLPEDMPYSKTRRMRIYALGGPVLVEQIGQATAKCKRLVYFVAAKQGRLEGTIDDSVTIVEGDNRTIVATRLFYDGKAGTVRGEGPGYMEQIDRPAPNPANPGGLNLPALTGREKKMNVRWREGFHLRFGNYEKLELTGRVRKQYLKHATFRGAVKMDQLTGETAQPAESIAGELITLKFAAPDPNTVQRDDMAGTIETAQAEGNVVMRSENQQIECQELLVTFGPGTSGPVPATAAAKGHVRAREGKRVIKADELDVVMEEKPTDADTTKKTKRTTVGFGRVAFRQVHARGNVRIDDPDRGLNVISHKLECRLDPQGTIQWCYLEGTANKWARAVSRDNLISGQQITLDLKAEHADVPGAGELQFVSNRDIEGTAYRDPKPVIIRWSSSMTTEGGSINQGVFRGQVTVESEETTLYCHKLVVDFEQRPETPKAKPAKRRRFAIFDRLVRGRRTRSTTVKLPLARKRPVYIEAIPKKGQGVRVQNRVDEHDTLITRTTLEAKQLTIDLGAQKLDVPCPGTLLIEDYRLPADQREKTALKDPFGMDVKGTGPSQTLFGWSNGLTYLLDKRNAIFDGDVWMLHRAGKAVLAQMRGLEPKRSAQKREANLTCENLVVEFVRGPFGPGSGARAGAGELGEVVATGSVHFIEGQRSAMARQLVYNNLDKMLVILGADDDPAEVREQGDDGRILNWNGPLLIWNRKTGGIRGAKPTIRLIRSP